jgi:quercetin dioxygenase-like cupin family protein
MGKFIFLISCLLLMSLGAPNAPAQVPGVTSKLLLQTTLTDDPAREISMVLVEFPPGTSLDRHTHPGEEFSVVLQGTLEIVSEGREARRLSAGDVFHNPRGLIHQARNVGDTPVRLTITFILDKGKPLVLPAVK